MSVNSSYSPNYFSIEDILVTQERTPCKFLVNGHNLGFLNPNAEENDLKAGTPLELPLWAVQSLSSGGHTLVAPELPKVYKEAYREILKADPNAVNLHKFNINFYELGCYVKNFDTRGDVAAILIRTFQERFRQIMDLANNTISDPSVVDRLDNSEKRLYCEGQVMQTKLNEWLTESSTPLEAADMVVNLRKRKRIHESFI